MYCKVCDDVNLDDEREATSWEVSAHENKMCVECYNVHWDD